MTIIQGLEDKREYIKREGKRRGEESKAEESGREEEEIGQRCKRESHGNGEVGELIFFTMPSLQLRHTLTPDQHSPGLKAQPRQFQIVGFSSNESMNSSRKLRISIPTASCRGGCFSWACRSSPRCNSTRLTVLWSGFLSSSSPIALTVSVRSQWRISDCGNARSIFATLP